MTETAQPFTPLEPEILVASFTQGGTASHRDRVWENVFGSGEDPWQRLSEEDAALARKYVQDALLGNLVTNEVFQVQLTGRNDLLPVLLNFIPVYLPAETSQPVVTAVTVTGEILAEPASWTTSQTQRHRMENLGRMTMGIAHDFNNLLSGILGHTELIKSTYNSTMVAPEFGENIRTIEQAAQDGAMLIRKIQQYIRQEKQDRFDVLDVNTAIRDCVALTRPYWYNEPRRQGISIDTTLDLADVPPISGSATELREVFVNLILNAVQAMSAGGRIWFRTRYQEDQGVVIIVQDTGSGMSESVRKRIFEPLFTTKGNAGSGMGLAVSYGIIQEHEGSIEVASQIGTGTTFTITFPPAGQDALPVAKAVPYKAGHKARVLVVDDEVMVRKVLDKLLSLNGHTVAQADSGTAALALLGKHSFDIVFTDNGMPEMNGRQLARAIRERYPSLPVVLITGDTETGQPDENVNVILGKPFKLERLEETIQQLLDSASVAISH
jgi:two-component system, cell cycle sensor histidine kinase and response regulator CckA